MNVTCVDVMVRFLVTKQVIFNLIINGAVMVTCLFLEL